MMTMTPGIRKIALTAHVTSSVGWLGAVGGFLALAVAGLASSDDQIVRGAYLAMELTGWCVIVPLSLASLLTGLVQSLGTTWGLFRHYWVVAKLTITVFASILLLLHMQVASRMASAAAKTTLTVGDFRGLRMQLVGDGIAAIVVLLAATALSVFKPQGLTSYGRKHDGKRDAASSEFRRGSTSGTPRWAKVFFWAVAVALIVAVLIKHLGGGFHHH